MRMFSCPTRKAWFALNMEASPSTPSPERTMTPPNQARLHIVLYVLGPSGRCQQQYLIRVIKSTRACDTGKVAFVFAVVVDDIEGTVPGVLDVIVVAPDVAVFFDGSVVGLHR